MPTVDHIRTRYEKGDTITSIAKDLALDRKTVRKYARQEDFSPKPPVKRKAASILDPYKAVIREWMDRDAGVWRKQRHTAKRIFERLRDEKGYTGSYPTVQRYVKAYREQKILQGQEGRRDGYLQLEWEPGSAQADFGEADFQLDGRITRLHYLAVTFPFSNTGYVQVFGGETAECVCEGLKNIFDCAGGVPRRVVFDNATGIGQRIGSRIREAELFRQFRLHYGFEAEFCNPHSGNEKGSVEKFVGTARRHLFVPVPEIGSDLRGYNARLLQAAAPLNDHMHYRKERRQTELFEDDRKAFRMLPQHPFEACRYVQRKTDRYGRILLDGRHYYSTRPELQQTEVTAALGAYDVCILTSDGTCIARHARQFGKARTESTDPATSLALLARNIRAWPQCTVRRCVSDPLREYMDGLDRDGRRHVVRILKSLSGEFGFETAEKAVTATAQLGAVRADDAFVVAARIRSGGLDMVPAPGPALGIYDDMFLRSGGTRR